MSPPGEPAGHSDFEGMAVAHVLGGLDEEQGRLFRAHLLECEDCRARVGELRAIASDLAGVERRARHEQQQGEAERTLDIKERAELAAAAPPARPAVWPRVALVVALAVVIGLSVYLFLLRGEVARLEQEVAELATASSVLQHGADVPLDYQRAGISATVRADGGDVAVVVDELDDDATYRVALVDRDGEATTEPATVEQGRLFVLVTRQPDDERLRVRRGDGQLIVEADLGDAASDA